jgi:hypothetical protein
MKCVDCGGSFETGEAFEVRGEVLCVLCEARRSPVAVQPVKAPIVRDAANACRVSAMKAFFKAAQSDGMDTKNADGMRAALAGYLGRVVNSRRDLSAGEWREAAAGVECCLLAW